MAKKKNQAVHRSAAQIGRSVAAIERAIRISKTRPAGPWAPRQGRKGRVPPATPPEESR